MRAEDKAQCSPTIRTSQNDLHIHSAQPATNCNSIPQAPLKTTFIDLSSFTLQCITQRQPKLSSIWPRAQRLSWSIPLEVFTLPAASLAVASKSSAERCANAVCRISSTWVQKRSKARKDVVKMRLLRAFRTESVITTCIS